MKNWTKVIASELCYDVKRKEIFVQICRRQKSCNGELNRLSQIAIVTNCCNILQSEIPAGIKVSFENIVSEIILNYNLI